MSNLKLSQNAPDFSLKDQNGQAHELGDYKGQWVLLYFYPKDDTPGCTTEACRFRDNLPDFKNIDAVILGVSVDDVDSHKRFAKKYSLPFALLADADKTVVRAYGVRGKKSFAGKDYEGTNRTSFLINPEGKIAKIYENVKPEAHATEILADLKSLKAR